jgi:hypothetical protein
MGVVPLQPPVLPVRVWPSCAVPEMVGADLLAGGQLDCRDRHDGFDDAAPASPNRMATQNETVRLLAARLLAAKRDIADGAGCVPYLAAGGSLRRPHVPVA